MLGNLIEKINQTKSQSLQIIRNLPVIELSYDDCRNFEAFIRRTLNVKSICGSYSFQVETSPDHWAVCSNQYLALAAVAYDLALCLKKYFDFFDLKIRSNERESKLVIKLQNEFKNSAIQDIPKINDWLTTNNSMAYISHCKENEEDKDSLCYFLAGIDSKKFGNEKGVLRGTLDLFGAYILSTEPVTTAASGFLGSLVFALAQEPSFYERISNVFKESSQRHLCRMDDKDHSSLVSPLSSISPPSQIIYYGVPGCGKSYEVNKDINEKLDKYGVTDREYHKVRCVFHPEYCNADFVGQIYPYVKPDNGGVEYRFKPGPFAEIVRRAYRNPAEPFFLIIEEINRGNAAAIFGEIFQLLDRIRPEDGSEELSSNIYDTGWSSYGVTNIDVNAYVRQKSTDNPEKIEYDDSIPYGDKINFINNTAIRLPPNLSIYATMNTSDQNVFTMDNAFQRRFKSKMIRNSLDNTAQFDLKIGDTGVRWGDFREWINEKILAPETGLKKAEDKCLGGWFIKGEKKTDQNGKVSNESKDFPKDEFAEKVLKYLWNDVFKRSAAENIFLKGKVSSLTNLIELFESGEKFAAFENVFVINAADKDKLLSQKNNP